MRTSKNKQSSFGCGGEISSQDLPNLRYIDRHNQVFKNQGRIKSGYMLNTTLQMSYLLQMSAKADLLKHLYNSSSRSTAFEEE